MLKSACKGVLNGWMDEPCNTFQFKSSQHFNSHTLLKVTLCKCFREKDLSWHWHFFYKHLHLVICGDVTKVNFPMKSVTMVTEHTVIHNQISQIFLYCTMRGQLWCIENCSDTVDNARKEKTRKEKKRRKTCL